VRLSRTYEPPLILSRELKFTFTPYLLDIINKMKLAILNECFFNDSHLERLKKIGELTVYSDTNSEELAVERLKDVDIAIADCFICPLNSAVLSSTDKLNYLAINSTGYDLVDLSAAKEKAILVSNIPGFATEAVAEQAIALMFAVIRRIAHFDSEMRKNVFEVDPEKDFHLAGFNVLSKTLGIVGLGSIGMRVAEIGKGLGMKVIAYNRSEKSVDGIEMVSLDDLLRESDVVSVHLPLTLDTENIIGEKELGMMKQSAILINTARGKHVNGDALFNALSENKIYGAGLDILDDMNINNPLLKLENAVITPHSGWLTNESFENLAEMVTSNVEAFASGSPKNIVT